MMDREAFADLRRTVPCAACRDGGGAAVHEASCYVSRRVKMSVEERAAHDEALDKALGR